MSLHHASRVVIVTLIGLLPVYAHSAEAERSGHVSTAVSADDLDLEAVGERIRQTGAQMRADLKEARARMETQKREAERARQQAIKEASQKQAQ